MQLLRTTLTLVLAIVVSPATAQVGSPAAEPEELVNYPYSAGDTAFYNVVGQSVQAVRLPISYTIRSLDEHPWGVKLRFPVSLGLHEFSASSALDGELVENVATISGLAGFEFQIPAGARWTLRPFAEFGAGKDFDGDGFAWIYSAGLNSVMEIEKGKVLYRFGLGLEYDGATLSGGGASNGYTTLEAGLDVRFPLRGALGSRRVDWSVYAIRRRFLDPLTFEQVDGEQYELSNQNELGVTFGVERPWKLWLLKIQRLGLGVRFGGRLTSVRILFSVPF